MGGEMPASCCLPVEQNGKSCVDRETDEERRSGTVKLQNIDTIPLMLYTVEQLILSSDRNGGKHMAYKNNQQADEDFSRF
jgi:hypothetical protein